MIVATSPLNPSIADTIMMRTAPFATFRQCLQILIITYTSPEKLDIHRAEHNNTHNNIIIHHYKHIIIILIHTTIMTIRMT